jgi:O-antigen ligase
MQIDSDTAPTGSEAPAEAAARSRLPFSAAAIETALAVTGFGTFVVWAWRDGGFAPEEWLPGGLLFLGLLCTAVASADVRARLRARRLPLTLFGLYVVWSYLSIAWAQVQGDALDGANRTLVYWLVFALFTGLGLSERVGAAVVLAWGGALAALGLIALAEAGTASTPAGHFVQGRFAAPLSYPDGDAALYLSACLPLLVLATRPRAHFAARLTACVSAVVLADLAVLCQSRGSLVALSCALVAYLAIARSRLRALLQITIAAAAVAPAVPTLLHVYSAVIAGHGRADAVGNAAAWIAGSAALATLGMCLLLLLERHVGFSERSLALIGRGVLALAGLAVVAAVLVAASSHPVGRAERAWHDFTTNKTAEPGTLHFAAGAGTSRYDVWRIAWGQFLAHPLNGVGADNYLVGYLRHRRTTQTSRYPESTELRTLSETGIVGAGLFLGFLAIVFLQAIRAARRSRSPGLALACLVGCGYWLLHSSIDWFWEIPVLTGAALALLAIASAPPSIASPQPTRRRLSLSLKAITAGAALLSAAVFAIPWASVSLIDAAVARGAGSSAYSLLATAARLNPLSEEPAITEATLAANAGDRTRERRALLDAQHRDPYDWYTYFMLGIVAGREHHPGLSRTLLEEAHRRSPKDLVIVYAQRHLRWGEPLSERRVGQIFREVTSTLRGVRQK